MLYSSIEEILLAMLACCCCFMVLPRIQQTYVYLVIPTACQERRRSFPNNQCTSPSGRSERAKIFRPPISIAVDICRKAKTLQHTNHRKPRPRWELLETQKQFIVAKGIKSKNAICSNRTWKTENAKICRLWLHRANMHCSAHRKKQISKDAKSRHVLNLDCPEAIF